MWANHGGAIWPCRLLGDRLPNDRAASTRNPAAVMTLHHVLSPPCWGCNHHLRTSFILGRPAHLCHLSSGVTVPGCKTSKNHHHKDNNIPIILTADLDLTKLLTILYPLSSLSNQVKAGYLMYGSATQPSETRNSSSITNKNKLRRNINTLT